MKEILKAFKNKQKECKNITMTFPINADDPQSMKFIEYLNDNRDIVQHDGKIIFMPFGKNVDRFLCGIAPIWKEYDNKQSFEYFYKNSEMMRELFCNEKDKDDRPIQIYANIAGVKYIITWKSTEQVDQFHYSEASPEDRGLLDMLWHMFGGIVKNEDDSEIKQLNPKIGVTFEVYLSKDYGYSFGITKSVFEHAKQLGYAVGGSILLGIG